MLYCECNKDDQVLIKTDNTKLINACFHKGSNLLMFINSLYKFIFDIVLTKSTWINHAWSIKMINSGAITILQVLLANNECFGFCLFQNSPYYILFVYHLTYDLSSAILHLKKYD